MTRKQLIALLSIGKDDDVIEVSVMPEGEDESIWYSISDVEQGSEVVKGDTSHCLIYCNDIVMY